MKRIYIPVLLVLLLAALPELAWAASPSYVASVTCDDRSHDLAYPAADFDEDGTDCLAEYAIPYPAADFEGDGISSFPRSTTLNSRGDLDPDTTLSVNPDQTALEWELSGRFGQLRSYGNFARAWTDLVDHEATVNSGPTALEWELSGRFGQVRSYGTFARAWADPVDQETTVNSGQTALELELSGGFGQVRSYGTFARSWDEYSSALRQQ